MKDAAWSYVGGGPHRGEVWGVLDAASMRINPNLLLAHSSDGGATFTLVALHKPDPKADFDSFCIGPDKKGRVTVYVSPDPDSRIDQARLLPLSHERRREDVVRPEYEPDVMWPAHDVPDEDQPAAPDQPPRKA